ncbi:NADH-quinone oxidoreductase subunit C [Paenibacillus sp. UNC451MF]|uniref:NADH-quinone oxidoreductase subunit C n=1 Tax=Paenibacillus sp. UNC451MF TaxID=1449063 RepID=UPI00048A4AD5|nr:NADH-quinone oxidoreductase subunit C [Paenibacillus sp. UNC451MF]
MSDEQKKDGLQPEEEVKPSASAETSSAEPQAGTAAKEVEGTVKPAEAALDQKESDAASQASGDSKNETKPVDDTAAPVKPARPERRAAAAASESAAEGATAEKAAPTDEEKEAKAKAAAEARAARANARAKKPESEEESAPKEPSPNQPRLDLWVKILKDQLGNDIVEEAFINERDAHLPYIVIKNDRWFETAEQLRDHSDFKMNYLRNVSGIDQETHMEVAYHLLSLDTKQEICIKIKTNRETPSIPSVTPVWPTANWNEREIYDLLGIDFPGHPDMRRIMMSDDWVGHPLRKDYEPLDPEV